MGEALTTLMLPAAAYLLCFGTLCAAAWLVTCWVVPNSCRGGLRLALVLIGQVALNAIVIQTLGVLGKLRVDYYLGTCALIGALSIWCLRRWFAGRSLLRLVRHHVRLWLWSTPFGLGGLGFGIVGFLALRCSLVEGVDSLSIHGPMIVEWLQTQHIPLLWHFNYPLCWEYQFTANMLLMGSDILVVLPRIWIALTLLLMLKEVGRQIGLSGGLSQLIAWMAMLTPLVLGVHGQGSLKNDAALAVGLLACLLGIDRLWRALPSGFWCLVLGVFLAIGMKSTGIILGLGFLFLGMCIGVWHGYRRSRKALGPKRIGWILVAVILFQATPMALPVANYLENGSPFFPIIVRVGDWIELPGRANLKGTSILDHRDDPGIWQLLWLGSAKRISFETLIVLPLFVLGLFWWVTKWAILAVRRGPRVALFDRRHFPLVFYAVAAAALFLIYLATPWSAGAKPGSLEFVVTGGSLRYGLVAVVLIYLGAAAFLSHLVGPEAARRLLILALPVVFYQRWSPSFFHLTRVLELGDANLLILGFLVILALLGWAGRGLPRLDRVLRRSKLGEAGWPVAVLTLFLSLLPLYAEFVSEMRWRVWGTSSGPSAGFRKVWAYVWKEMPPGSVIACNLKQPAFNFAYYFYGPRFENRFLKVRDPITGPKQDLPPEVQYFYVTYYGAQPKLLQQSIQTLKSRGWYTVARVDGHVGALMKRQKKTDKPNPRPPDSNSRPKPGAYKIP